jgi:hypothetical protein
VSDWSGAKAQLRETAKWTSGGVLATAAAVLAGSSLTKLGSLSPLEDTARLLTAVGGSIVAFAALGILMQSAIRVLIVEDFSMRRMLALNAPADYQTVLGGLETDYRASISEFGGNIAAMAGERTRLKVDKPIGYQKRMQTLDELVEEMADLASFRLLELRFDRMIDCLFKATIAVVIGVGFFAWAANPPEKKAAVPNPQDFRVRLIPPIKLEIPPAPPPPSPPPVTPNRIRRPSHAPQVLRVEIVAPIPTSTGRTAPQRPQ